MKFRDFLKDNLITLILLVFILITIEIFLMIYSFNIVIKIYIPISILFVYFISIIVIYYNKKIYYNNILNILEDLDQKYLVTELIDRPNFFEGKILKNVVEEIGKSMLENVNKYKYMQEDYKEYIELWIHEIKIPIATSKMIIENNKTEVTESINEEINKIENYIEQALFYARSNTVEKDYYIKRSNLKEIVNNSILKNKDTLIQNKINIHVHDLDKKIYTDSKWCMFILNQIIQNSIKYSKEDNKKIEIYAIEKKEKVILYIEDNGIGIKKGEITRVFEKGFTGENGRKNGRKSTGIGLYLCKKLCNKLGIGLELNSEKDVGTEVKMIFPKNSFMEMKISVKKYRKIFVGT